MTDHLADASRRQRLLDNPPKPEVGMPATYCVGSDSYAMVIVDVTRTGHQVAARYADSSYAAPKVFTRRKNGGYREKGSQTYGSLLLGFGHTYRDPSY
jgi:hypothetical protein